MTKKTCLIIIICASLITHFLFFGQPKETVFDEVHFGKFISGYFTHEYFFDIHPPLGKLLISGMGYITGFKPGFSFAEIGQQFPNHNYLWLRLLPTLAGALLPIIIFLLILELGFSSIAAFAGGLMIILENALLIQSRFILLDAFLLLFGFSAVLFYFLFQRTSKIRFLILAGMLAALSASVKWTGLTFLLIVGVLYFIRCAKSSGKIRELALGLIFLAVMPAIIYFSIFATHFLLLTKSGAGDAFMTPEFRRTLIGSADNINAGIKPLNIFQKFKELNVQMYKSNANLTASHPYSSKWYTWPFMIRPIYYWNQRTDNDANGAMTAINEKKQSRIYLLGNPVIWWASTIAMLYLLLNVLTGLHHNIKPGLTPALLIGTYLLNLLPFIGISRAMFLYHYFVGLIFAIIALVYLLDRLKNQAKKKAVVALLIASIAAFVFFAPLTYGLPLSEKAYHLRNWLSSWI